MKKKIFFASGGTGGHLFPAMSLLNFYKDLGYEVYLGTDNRGKKYFRDNNEINYYKIHIGFPPDKKIIKKVLFTLRIFFATIRSFFLIQSIKPNLIIGFGGYIAFPFCIVAKIFNISLIIYEPNLVLGKANRILLPFATKLLLASKHTQNIPKKHLNKIVEVGSLVRATFFNDKNSIKKTKDQFTLLVLGGSQGADIFTKIVPDLVKKVSISNLKIKIIQQCLKDQIEKLRSFYNAINVENYIFDFEYDIEKLILQSNLVITRCGASTTAELINFKKPFIGVPYPYAKDNHQYYNVKFYEDRGCCWLIEQKNFNVKNLFKLITDILTDKSKIGKVQDNMKKFHFDKTPEKIHLNIKNIFDEN